MVRPKPAGNGSPAAWRSPRPSSAGAARPTSSRSSNRPRCACRSNAPATPTTYRVLVALGDDDPNQQVEKLARLLLNVPKVEKIDLAVKPQHPDLERLRELAATVPERLEVAVEPAEITARLARCQFA